MQRFTTSALEEWKTSPRRKPLVVRGARQVGKSYLVEDFGRRAFDRTVTLNLERDPELGKLFASNDPRRIVRAIELQRDARIDPGDTLLFLDEIQAAPAAFGALRYFHEEMPDLHLIAAGSLLDLALRQPSFPVPVGRIEYLHLGPLTFEEFLLARGNKGLLDFISGYDFAEPVPESLHGRLIDLVREFFVVGGMPAPLAAFVQSGALADCEAEKQSILSTLMDDFGKYATRSDPRRLRRVFTRLPLLLGRKLKFAAVDPGDQARNLARALDLLCEARVAHRIFHSSANGIPLRAEGNERVFKPLFVDVGLATSSCGLNLLDFERVDELTLVNSGAICEQFVGQHLLHQRQSFMPPELFYWVREKRGSSAEVDYLLAAGAAIVPLEVKAGATGKLKSMQVFLAEKGRSLGVRINSDRPTRHDAHYALPRRTEQTFRLLSIPFYLVGQVRRLIDAELGR